MNITQTEIEATVKAHYGGGLDPSEIWAQCAAYHIAEMYQMPPGETMRCGIGDAFLRITIEKSPMSTDENADENACNVWDTVYIAPGDADDSVKGVCCGNRSGGRDTMALLYHRAIKGVLRSWREELGNESPKGGA